MRNINQKDNVLILNGHTVRGYSDAEDCLQVPDEVEIAMVNRGADGLMVGASTGEIGGPIRIKLQPTSASCKFMLRQLQRMKSGSAPNVWRGSITNTPLNFSSQLEGGVLTTGPFGHTVGKGKAPERVFMIEFEAIDLDYDAADFDEPPRTN